MSALPATVKYPETFNNSPAFGFDGAFDWSWTQGAFGAGRITPMDFDGVVERKGNFILFETKGAGVPIPKGQMFTFESAFKLGVFTIVFIEGKNAPEFAKVWCAAGFKNSLKMEVHAPTDAQRMANFVSEWFEFADKNPAKKVDTSFLNNRISKLSSEIDGAKQHIQNLVKSLGGVVSWS